jgi:hypothetical protein|eukprot:COSAG01_NODE_5694_length_4092_cov_11.524418_7_plen_147_part_00
MPLSHIAVQAEALSWLLAVLLIMAARCAVAVPLLYPEGYEATLGTRLAHTRTRKGDVVGNVDACCNEGSSVIEHGVAPVSPAGDVPVGPLHAHVANGAPAKVAVVRLGVGVLDDDQLPPRGASVLNSVDQNRRGIGDISVKGAAYK